MTTQTLAEKLRILTDAAEAGEVMVYTSSKAISYPYSLDAAILYINTFDTISRIRKSKELIKVGERWINAPLREMPKEGDEYWGCASNGILWWECWAENSTHRTIFHNSNCWATKEDAIAWHEASLALRKGGAV